MGFGFRIFCPPGSATLLLFFLAPPLLATVGLGQLQYDHVTFYRGGEAFGTMGTSRQGSQKPVKPVRAGSGLGRYQTGPNSKFKFEFKKIKKSQKNPKNTSRCDESNGVKFSQKFVHLV